MLSSLSVTWRWKDIGFCGESGILFKLLRSFSPSTPHLQPLLGNMGTFVQSELGVLRESLGRAQEPYFLFLFCTITKKKIFLTFWPCSKHVGILVLCMGMEPSFPAVEAQSYPLDWQVSPSLHLSCTCRVTGDLLNSAQVGVSQGPHPVT